MGTPMRVSSYASSTVPSQGDTYECKEEVCDNETRSVGRTREMTAMEDNSPGNDVLS